MCAVVQTYPRLASNWKDFEEPSPARKSVVGHKLTLTFVVAEAGVEAQMTSVGATEIDLHRAGMPALQ
jgi:hypothetical protein